MSNEVKSLTQVVREDLAALKDQAATLAAELRANISEVAEGLSMAKEVSTALRDAGAELRGALGVQTNSPPPDDPKPT